jgi:DegV family protein with EDD domain
MRTIVVTDSSGECPHRRTDRSIFDRVVVVPISVLLGDRERTDETADVADILRALDEGIPVKTRAPSAIDYVDAMEVADADAAVVITPAAEITTMWRHASNAVYVSGRPAAVVDSRSAAVGHSLVVEAAMRRAVDGGSLTEVVHAARDAVRRVRFVAALFPMDTLVGSGVVPSPSIERARSDTHRALFELHDGRIDVISTVPAATDIVDALVSELRDRVKNASTTAVGFTADERDAGARLAHAIGTRDRVLPFSPAMTAHTGPGALAVAWLAAES